MTTTMNTTHLPNQAQLVQLVLFPELGVAWVPLNQCQQSQPEPAEEPRGRLLTLKEALAAGQMPLW